MRFSIKKYMDNTTHAYIHLYMHTEHTHSKGAHNHCTCIYAILTQLNIVENTAKAYIHTNIRSTISML